MKMTIPLKISGQEIERLMEEVEFCESDYVSEFVQQVIELAKEKAKVVKNEAERLLKATSL